MFFFLPVMKGISPGQKYRSKVKSSDLIHWEIIFYSKPVISLILIN